MLQDTYGRKFHYLRLSIIDICNFQCNYCLPDGNDACRTSPYLSLDEIAILVRAFAESGTQKIRLTGGEPSLRKDLAEIISICKNTPGIKQVALTTNGYRLAKEAQKWKDAGLDRLNVSIDSLDPKMFQCITRHNRLESILKGLDIAEACGFEQIKINAVLLKQFNQHEFQQYLDWIKNKSYIIRFIELMQTGNNARFFEDNHVSGEPIKQKLLEAGWVRELRSKTAGPAQEFSHSEYAGRIGLIMPYSKDFCKHCNRLRVTAQGKLHLCLFGEQGLSLRHLCHEDTFSDLKQQLAVYLNDKKESHFLQKGHTGVTRHLAMLGG